MGLNAGEFETALLAELRLGLPPTFYFQLVEIEDDWAFVLKMHSFFEGALTQLLKEKLRLRTNTRESLTPRDSFTSRVHLASRMQLMEPDYGRFLLALNRLRNEITHNISFIAFDLRSHADQMPEATFRKVARELCVGFQDVPLSNFRFPTPKNARPRRCNSAREMFWHISPKFSIWYSGVWTLDLISLHFHLEEVEGSAVVEPGTEAKLQDLMLDPAIIDCRRRLRSMWPNSNEKD